MYCLFLAGHQVVARAWLLVLPTITLAVAALTNTMPCSMILIALLPFELIEPINVMFVA